MTKYMPINGEEFRVIKSKRTKDMITNWRYAGRTLLDCYDRPSTSKYEIYENWRDWYRNANYVQCLGVASYNTFQFTLGAILIGDNTAGLPIGFIQITPTENRLYVMSDEI